MNDHELKRALETMTETVRPERVEDRVRERLAVKEERKRIRFPRAAVVACVLALTFRHCIFVVFNAPFRCCSIKRYFYIVG